MTWTAHNMKRPHKAIPYGAIEAGGTKVLCDVGRRTGELLDHVTIPTRSPHDTLPDVIAFFRTHQVRSLGVASFGPLDLDPTHATYGALTNTPKVAWRGVNWFRFLTDSVKIPVTIETDVNAAILAEHAWGSAISVHTALYVTVGTGIGGGAMVAGRPLHGLMHPEMGHIGIHKLQRDVFPGLCPVHGDCLEGLASGPALSQRWHVTPDSLPAPHRGWSWEADYLAQALATYIYVLSPQRIVLGGGVMRHTLLFPAIRQRVVQLLQGYIERPELQLDKMDNYIVPAQLGSLTGLYGGLQLAISSESSR